LRALGGVEKVNEVLELKFTGIGESDFHDGIDERLAGVVGLEYGYCAHIGEVDLRLIGSADALKTGREIAVERFEKFLISDNGSSLEKTVVDMLAAKGMTLATAESCTGGLIGHRITNVPGSSEVYTDGFITYSNSAKIRMLGVSAEDIAQHGAVSETVARQMAEGARRESDACIAVAVTGIAGPGGGTEDKPVGTAWVAVAVKGGDTDAFRIFHPRNRKDFKLAVSQAALDAVRRRVKQGS
jgi:nicotinamide-nucleotide amidase